MLIMKRTQYISDEAEFNLNEDDIKWDKSRR